MKLLHLSDLHLGKRVYEANFLEEQKYILEEIKQIIHEEAPNAVMIAGDIYDKAVPPIEAIQLFDDFVTFCAAGSLPLCIISGNHDSTERISFASRLLDKQGIYFSPGYDGNVRGVTLTDEYGKVNIHMLPFIKPAHVKRVYPEAEIENYEQAIQTVLSHMELDASERNVLMLHQFVTGASMCDSDYAAVGGLEQLPYTLFDSFDYVALGHIHGPQKIGRETIRYCGTPLKYSFSEVSHKKSVTVLELKRKGETTVRTIPLKPLHDMRCIQGSYMELTNRANYIGTKTDDYLQITLTDEEDIPDAIGRLRSIYPNLLKLSYDNTRTRKNAQALQASGVPAEERTPLQFLEELYQLQNQKEMNEEQKQYSMKIIEKVWEECDEAR